MLLFMMGTGCLGKSLGICGDVVTTILDYVRKAIFIDAYGDQMTVMLLTMTI